MTSLVSILRVIIIDEVLSIFFSTLMFVKFSEPVELRMGRSNMAAFLCLCFLGSLAVVRSTTMIRRVQDVPVDIIIRACGSACLCYLAVAANNPNKIFVIDGLTISKQFRWNSLQMDYSQVLHSSTDFYEYSTLSKCQLFLFSYACTAHDFFSKSIFSDLIFPQKFWFITLQLSILIILNTRQLWLILFGR